MNLRDHAYKATKELIEIAGLEEKDLLVVGCSTGEAISGCHRKCASGMRPHPTKIYWRGEG